MGSGFDYFLYVFVCGFHSVVELSGGGGGAVSAGETEETDLSNFTHLFVYVPWRRSGRLRPAKLCTGIHQ